MAVHLAAHRDGFKAGWTELTRADEREHATGIALSVLRLSAGEGFEETAGRETAWLLMDGVVRVHLVDREVRFERGSLFDELPSCLHVPAGEEVRLEAESDVELTVYRVDNGKPFEPRVYGPDEVRSEWRGRGQVDDASLRIVRTIFDDSNSDEDTELVLGEVVHLPGRWSSYPPHHHTQPEIYHYRFTAPQGYGHAELGEDVLKVRNNDTVKIAGGLDHAQVAAPGYGMYYSWVIRHLLGDRYRAPEFTEEHRWVTDADARFWSPRDGGERAGSTS
jgi:5-deoxy-glucuronate isomerase